MNFLFSPGSAAGGGEFVAGDGVDDLELFRVESGFSPEGEFPVVTFLHFDEDMFVLGSEPFEDGGGDDDPELEVRLIAWAFLEDFGELTLDLDGHGFGALHHAATFAVGAIVEDG